MTTHTVQLLITVRVRHLVTMETANLMLSDLKKVEEGEQLNETI